MYANYDDASEDWSNSNGDDDNNDDVDGKVESHRTRDKIVDFIITVGLVHG